MLTQWHYFFTPHKWYIESFQKASKVCWEFTDNTKKMLSYVVFAPKIRLKLRYLYFVLNKVPLLHNNGSCILISNTSSKNIVIVVWMLWKFETDWRKEIEFERLKIIDGCAHIFDSHKIHKCQMIKTLNVDNGMEYCCSE